MTWNRTPEALRGAAPRKEVRRLGPERAVSKGAGAALAVDSTEVVNTITVAVVAGCGILFGSTADGGALVVSVFVDQVVHKGYASTADELKELLLDARDICEAQMLKSTAQRAKVAKIGS